MLWVRVIALAALGLLSFHVIAEEREKCGPYDGVDLTDDPVLLEEILSAHKEWLADSGRRKNDPRRANLCGAGLTGANLNNANLREADLSKAQLGRANLSKARLVHSYLEGTNLSKADLSEANLYAARLREANLYAANLTKAKLGWASLRNTNLFAADLSGADLNYARLGQAYLAGTNLSKADLSKAYLSKANLSGADVSEADLREAILDKAHLVRANLSKARLGWANLREADLSETDLSGAELNYASLDQAYLGGTNLCKARLEGATLRKASLFAADLSEADLSKADLSEADLSKADLSKANLSKANLSEARLIATDLTNTRVTDADFSGARYEPSSAPSKGYLNGIKGLRDVWFDEGNQGGLVLLRAALKEAGLRDLEREATYAIERGKTTYAPWLEKWLKRIFFEWTSGYGLNYGRPLAIVLSLLIPFAAVYYFPITGRGESKIYRVWSEERIEDGKPEGNPERRVEPLVLVPREERLSAIGFSLYFSLLSAVHIGWRDLNVGNWIARLQPRAYTLRPRGWVRTVSGIQSLTSIYLLALWVLTYFGRPFE